MAKQYLMTVHLGTIDPKDEEALSTWLDEVHIPEILRTTGLVRNVRYQRLGDAIPDSRLPHKFFHYYEIETDDIDAVKHELHNPKIPTDPLLPTVDRSDMVVCFYEKL